ncbi:MAG: WhiB family transcriptional regulator [Comamonadaceae bacterium]|nr:MAG: WhiB family transcriptional regulator [Comamonadaceae bacterium]
MPALSVTIPAPIAETWDWQLSAACRGADSSVFFHPDEQPGGRQPQRVQAAKRICPGCEVRAECLQCALNSSERYGIWGGLTELERRELNMEAPDRCPESDLSTIVVRIESC